MRQLLNKDLLMTGKTFIEVCSGAGGLSTGFINKGFIPLLLNDVDKWCVKTLSVNHPDINIHEGSMTDIDLSKYKNVDILMGGVPCQAFSQAGKREGVNDSRGKLIISFVEMIKQLEPRMFLIENVKGLISHDNGNTLRLILQSIKDIKKYKVNYKVLNSNNYGVPQKRERLIIVGVHNTITKDFSFPKENVYKPILRDVLIGCPESIGAKYPKKKEELFNLVPEGGCWIDIPEEKQKEYMGRSFYSGGGKRGILKRLDMNKPSLTLLTTPSQKQTERCHPIETRPLQVLEYSRIQTFPDDYYFSGGMTQIYKQIGNAVPVLLAEAIAESVNECLTII